METQSTTKKSFLQNDRLLVCSMLVFYGLCIIGLFAFTIWGLNRRERTIAANATSTASILSTQQAQVANTVIARLAQQDKYEYIERFDRPTSDWYVGSYEKKYGDLRLIIKNDVYIWDVTDTKGFTQSTPFYKGNQIKDFDIYVDLKFKKDYNVGAACSGFIFRRLTNDLNDGHYTFTICDDSRFEIYFYKENRWENIAFIERENSIQPFDWNRIEVIARGDHFTFVINNKEVFKMTDNRLQEGGLGLLIDIDKENPAEIWFDNFGYQPR